MRAAVLVFSLFKLASVDMNGDGKKDGIYIRPHVSGRVNVRDLGKPPVYDVEVILKVNGKFEKAGQIYLVDALRAANSWTIRGADGKFQKTIVIIEVRGDHTRYWGVTYPPVLFPVPKEMLPDAETTTAGAPGVQSGSGSGHE